ncbi:MAG: pantetheine-phosphate adenylyltransferase [Ruminococcaceae bacterium]|nr:pantetheine-phosphate adenylyltransferase [Oscillospiraceae bacterium]
MRTTIYPGSFDPITKGHLDIIKRAAKLFDKLIVVVLTNPDKEACFTIRERVEFVEKVTKDLENVEVDTFDGLLADYVKIRGAGSIVKGLRALSDFEYEFQMALTNKQINPDMETLFLNTSSEYMYLSSSIVKQVGFFGGDISDFVPEEIIDDITKKIRKVGEQIDNR